VDGTLLLPRDKRQFRWPHTAQVNHAEQERLAAFHPATLTCIRDESSKYSEEFWLLDTKQTDSASSIIAEYNYVVRCWTRCPNEG